jgi:hypothetical protein
MKFVKLKYQLHNETKGVLTMLRLNINIHLIASLKFRPTVKKSIYENKSLDIIEINYASLDEDPSK